MATQSSIGEHRTWEDWAGMALGVLVALGPWLVGQTDDWATVLNAAVVGCALVLIGALELIRLHRLEEIAEFAGGAWIFASPFGLGYAGAGPLRYWHFMLGAAIALLAILQLWQDWSHSDSELSRHGH